MKRRVIANFFNKVNPPTGGDPNHVKKSPVLDGQSYISHQGRQQRLRRLRQLCAKTLRSKDPGLMEAVERVRVATSTEATPEYGFLFLINRAQIISEESGVDLALAMSIMMDQLIELVTQTAPTQVMIGDTDVTEHVQGVTAELEPQS